VLLYWISAGRGGVDAAFLFSDAADLDGLVLLHHDIDRPAGVRGAFLAAGHDATETSARPLVMMRLTP